MFRPTQVNIGNMQQAEARNVYAGNRDVTRHIVGFALVGGNVGGIIVPHRMTAQDGGTLPPALEPDVAPVLVNVIPMPPLV